MIDLSELLVGVISLAVGGLAVYLTLRQQRFAKLDFVIERSSLLLNRIAQNIPDLQIHYKGDSVHNLVYLRAFMCNSGRKDLTREMVRRTITLKFTPPFRVLDANVDADASSPDSSLVVRNNSLLFDFDVLKVDEIVRFAALLVVPKEVAEAPVGKYSTSLDTA